MPGVTTTEETLLPFGRRSPDTPGALATVCRVLPAALAFTVLAGTAAAQEDPIARGRELAEQFCGECHAIGRTGDSPNVQAPPFRELQQSVDLDDLRRLRRGLFTGHPDMPEFKFGAADARALRDYIRSVQD